MSRPAALTMRSKDIEKKYELLRGCDDSNSSGSGGQPAFARPPVSQSGQVPPIANYRRSNYADIIGELEREFNEAEVVWAGPRPVPPHPPPEKPKPRRWLAPSPASGVTRPR